LFLVFGDRLLDLQRAVLSRQVGRPLSDECVWLNDSTDPAAPKSPEIDSNHAAEAPFTLIMMDVLLDHLTTNYQRGAVSLFHSFCC
jgi:hypothetical protein